MWKPCAYVQPSSCTSSSWSAVSTPSARACGMRSLAEGVETAEQVSLATELGCTFAQGYHFARPMPADEVAGWVLARSGRRAAAVAARPAR